MQAWRGSLQALLQSERTAWAVQNAVGALFAALFSVVLDLQFTLACLVGVLYSASSLVLSIDRSVGGRLFGGTVFIGTVLGGASLGGGLVSLAWLARGTGSEALIDYLPAFLQNVPSQPTTERMKELFARLTAVPLPPALQELVDAVVTYVSQDLYRLLPPISGAYWALLMVLAAVAFLPLAAARATRDFRKGIIIAIVFVFLSSMFVFGSLMPTLGQSLFWSEVVIGYFKVALAAAAANVVAGVLVCVRSAHDDVRGSCAAIFRGLGVRASRLGTAVSSAGDHASAALPALPSMPAHVTGQAAEPYLHSIQAYVDKRVAHCCQKAAVSCAAVAGGRDSCPVGASETDVVAGLPPMPVGASEAGLEVEWASLDMSLKTARLEPPLPLLCSQPMKNAAKCDT